MWSSAARLTLPEVNQPLLFWGRGKARGASWWESFRLDLFPSDWKEEEEGECPINSCAEGRWQ